MDPLGATATALLFLLAFLLVVIACVVYVGERPRHVNYGLLLVVGIVVALFVLAWNAAAVAW